MDSFFFFLFLKLTKCWRLDSVSNIRRNLLSWAHSMEIIPFSGHHPVGAGVLEMSNSSIECGQLSRQFPLQPERETSLGNFVTMTNTTTDNSQKQ
jgi:hypothetical protein